MRDYALLPKRDFDPANLAPLKVFKKPKVSLSNPTDSLEVTLRDKLPENIIQFAAFLKTLNGGKLDPVLFPSKRLPWQNQTISALYRRYFLHFHPEKFTLASYYLFLGLTLPSLVRFMSFESIRCLCSAIHYRNRKLLLAAKITQEKHRRRYMAVIYNTFIPVAPPHPEITKPLHREAWRILWALATHKKQGHFFIAGREFRDRLFVKSYKTAQRILRKFCDIGVIMQTSTGQTKWEAKKLGKRAEANTYRLNFEM